MRDRTRAVEGLVNMKSLKKSAIGVLCAAAAGVTTFFVSLHLLNVVHYRLWGTFEIGFSVAAVAFSLVVLSAVLIGCIAGGCAGLPQKWRLAGAVLGLGIAYGVETLHYSYLVSDALTAYEAAFSQTWSQVLLPLSMLVCVVIAFCLANGLLSLTQGRFAASLLLLCGVFAASVGIIYLTWYPAIHEVHNQYEFAGRSAERLINRIQELEQHKGTAK